MKNILFLVVFLFFAVICKGQKAVSVSGEYSYIVPENVSISDAKNIAIERARNEAMAKEFGTLVSQTNTSTVKNIGGKSETDFVSVGGTESKGIWLSDSKEPEIEIVYENNVMVVKAKVSGKAREIKNTGSDIAATLLCNGHESDRFINGDRFSIRFKSSSKGYLAVFLRNETFETYYCLLPYETEDGEPRAVKNNTDYVFLCSEDSEYPFAEQTILVTEKALEHNTAILVFSKNAFDLPLSEAGEFVPEITADKFMKWLRKNRLNDETMQVVEKSIEIRKK